MKPLDVVSRMYSFRDPIRQHLFDNLTIIIVFPWTAHRARFRRSRSWAKGATVL